MNALLRLATSDIRAGQSGSRRVKAALAEAGINLSRRQIRLVPEGMLLEALRSAQQRKDVIA
ncbi:hypothetical protein [Microbacterium sp. YJN-G]|uniref:hypothetical protein n=1 Tax=Microbacterium sp. YJN-G TaxID=2763257 RepID=UPI00187762C1|nr:hypothetical protein [Microbacterium sp. YJN-G]